MNRAGSSGETSRRKFLWNSLAGGGAALLGSRLFGNRLCAQTALAPSLIVRTSRPQNLETPRESLSSFLTPNEVFFVRSHFDPPPYFPGYPGWRLQVEGLVEKPLSLALEDLQRLERVALPATLQCAGNGRAFFRPIVPGVQWGPGAVGNAEWAGVRLRDVLQLAGLQSGARYVQLEGADLPPLPGTPAFTRSIPLEKALHPLTVLAWEMNKEPLPHIHGGPLRLVAPGWAGDHWMKWLRRITVRQTESEGFYMQTAYKMPRTPVAPGTTPRPEEMASVTELHVKSLIARPSEGSVLSRPVVEVSGVAFTGAGKIVKVELSVDGGRTWAASDLQEQRSTGSWQVWRWQWRPEKSAKVQILSRATDSNGNTQPAVAVWNPSGYLWNQVDKMECEVRT